MNWICINLRQSLKKYCVIFEVGAGVLSMSRTSMYSAFDDVKELEILPKQHLICLNESLNRNQVYADEEDFAFVAEYIKARCRNAKVKG